jgi:hypothetical protein
MRSVRAFVSLVVACVFFLETAGLAGAQAVQPIPYTPSQPVPAQGGPPPGPAPAGRGGNDAIYLKGGGMLRGTLVEMIPNDHATLTLPTGQTAIVEWARIERIERQGTAPPPGAAPPPPPPPQNHGSALVHLDADRDVTLETRTNLDQPWVVTGGMGSAEVRSFADARWTPACAAPCDKSLPIDNDYRITGPGIRTSKTFRLSVRAGEKVSIAVNAGSKGGFIGGIVLLGIGGAGVIIGLTVALVGAAESATESYNPVTGNFTQNNNGSGTETAGWIIALVGAAAAVVGVVLMVNNGKTKETQEQIAKGPASPAWDHGPGGREDAFLRLPTWHAKDAVESAIPRVTSLPVVSLHF